MIIVIIAIVTGLIAIVALIASIIPSTKGSEDVSRGATLTMSAVAAVITAALLGFGSAYTQDPGQAMVIRSFTGEVIGKDTTPGLNFTAPWNSIIEFDVRNQVVSYTNDEEDRDGNGIADRTGPAITAQDKDGATATIDVVVRYSVDPERVIDIYNQYKSQENFVSKLVQNDVRSVVRNVPLKYATSSFRLHREQAATEMQQALTERWKEDGIVVDSVDLRDIRYPESIEQSLQRVQEATNNANKAKADLETAKVEAEKTRVEAQAQADYDQIVRCGASVVTEKATINGQETNITKVVPNVGDACQNRLNDQVLMNKYIDALKEMADKGNIVVVPEGFGGILNLPGRQPQQSGN
ncbi:MAG: prohibitin family protein [Candidatus Saccharibacteria bacterium]|nr:prohibitin family protein [Candidatus Saccharibacteria bacterium]